MLLLSYIQALEGKSDNERLRIIQSCLDEWKIAYQLQPYGSGTNLFIKPNKSPYIGISCHFDVVPFSPGANDNASAIAIVIELIRRNIASPTQQIGLQFFFFDEEEKQLKGSKAYIKEFGIEGMMGLFNLEMVGQGDRLALWEVESDAKGLLLETLEKTGKENGVPVLRFNKIVTNYADHMSFRGAGVNESFSITCISQKDLEVSLHYYKAQELGVDNSTLQEIMAQAPLFHHYHQPTDKSDYLSEQTLQMTAQTLWQTIQALDKKA